MYVKIEGHPKPIFLLDIVRFASMFHLLLCGSAEVPQTFVAF